MAKLTRERKLQERRLDKQARKNARKEASARLPAASSDALTADLDAPGEPDAAQTDLEPVVHRLPGG